MLIPPPLSGALFRNILISGPTGSGKTYLVRTMAKMLGVPFVKADATKFSETGIVGEDAEDVVRQLVDAAGGSSAAGYGIVHLDQKCLAFRMVRKQANRKL